MQGKEQAGFIAESLRPALEKVPYPGFAESVLAMGLVREARLEGGKAVLRLKPLAAPAEVREELENALAATVGQVPGVAEVELDFPAPPAAKKERPGPRPLAGVKAVVPVASGKGGVGKSTVAVNLALGLARLGLDVGILDLDLYGPSLPTLLGLKDVTPGSQGDKLAPVLVHGIKAMSIGWLMAADRALIWRGPLIMKAVRQLLHEVAWAPLDVLVLDLPPGTGDVQITMAQEVPIAGAVVVTTPQDVALADAIRGVEMFRAMHAPVMGIVENMSYFVCPGCGQRHEIFGHGSVAPLCARLGVDYLGELPLDTRVRALSDQGNPPVIQGGEAGQPYLDLAGRIKDRLAALAQGKEA